MAQEFRGVTVTPELQNLIDRRNKLVGESNAMRGDSFRPDLSPDSLLFGGERKKKIQDLRDRSSALTSGISDLDTQINTVVESLKSKKQKSAGVAAQTLAGGSALVSANEASVFSALV